MPWGDRSYATTPCSSRHDTRPSPCGSGATPSLPECSGTEYLGSADRRVAHQHTAYSVQLFILKAESHLADTSFALSSSLDESYSIACPDHVTGISGVRESLALQVCLHSVPDTRVREKRACERATVLDSAKRAGNERHAEAAGLFSTG